MTTSTFYGYEADDAVASYDETWATARSGGTKNLVGNNLNVGTMYAGTHTTWSGTGAPYYYYAWETFTGFDTSTIPDTDTIDTATLSLYLTSDFTQSGDFVNRVRLFDWGATVGTDDWRSGNPSDANDLSEYTLLATKDTNGIGATGAYKDFTSEAAFVSNINKTGSTRVVISSSLHEAGTEPTGTHYVYWVRSLTSGTTQDPKLVVVHSGGSTNASVTPNTVVAAANVVDGAASASVMLVGPSTVGAAAAVPAPSVSTGGSITPTTVAAVAAVPAPSVALSAPITPGSVGAITDVPTPVVSAIANVSITPDTVVALASVPTPDFVSNAAITPASVDGLTSVPVPVVAVVTSVTPATVESAASVPTPVVSATGDAIITPTTVDAITSVPTPTVAASSSVTPAAVEAVAAVPGAVVLAVAAITPATVEALVSVETPVLAAGASVTPATVEAITSVPTPSVTVQGADAIVTFLDPPQNLTAQTISDDRIDLDWDPVTGATTYDIMRDGVVVHTNVTPPYSETGLDPSTTYVYRVKGRA